jgi:hypothetical protein
VISFNIDIKLYNMVEGVSALRWVKDHCQVFSPGA